VLTKRIHNVNALALDYFLANFEQSKIAKKYVFDRCSAKTAKVFNIGFAPKKKSGLVEYLNTHTDDTEAIVKSGLIFQDPDNYSYDFFYNRIIFPIEHGTRIVGFGGRTIAHAFPKYINTKKTAIYTKSRVLFGLSTTRLHILKTKKAILLEGYFDVVVLYDHDVRNCVAVCGTAFTKEHASLLSRYTSDVYVLLDGDVAGKKASKRARDYLKAADIYGGTLYLPTGQDPEDFIRAHGKAGLRKLKVKKT